MLINANYYKTLGLNENASIEEIKHAYRKLAIQYHPDQNKYKEDKPNLFIFITNAYKILSNEATKKEYDLYLLKRNKRENISKKGSRVEVKIQTDSDFYFDFNSILWDIEDILEKHVDDVKVKNNLVKILVFIEKWVLLPNGFPDYFSVARNIKQRDPYIIGKELIEHGEASYREFIDIRDYFYDIRKRMNNFILKKYSDSLLEEVESSKIRKIDGIIEAQNMSQYLLGEIYRYIESNGKMLPRDYGFSNSVFGIINSFI
jgi:curved DNA-binding protein CbpA